MRKEIRFSSLIDTREFDKAIESMQKKLQSMNQASEKSRSFLDIKTQASRVGLGAAPTQGEKLRVDQDERKSRRELDAFIKDQVKSQEQIAKTIAKQLEQKKELSKLAKEDYQSALKLLDLEKAIATNREKMKVSGEATTGALQNRNLPGFNGNDGYAGVFSRSAAAYRGATAGGGGSMIDGLMAGARGFGRGVAGMGAAGMMGPLGLLATVSGFAGNIQGQAATAPREVLNAQGTARGVYGQSTRDVFSGNAFNQMAYAPQSANAMKMANLEIEKQKSADTMSFAGRATGYGLAGAGIGTAILPGIGTAIGGGLGALYGGLTGEKGLIAQHFGTYQAGLEERRSSAFAQNLESQKNLDPARRAALDRYQQEVMPNLTTQRATGMNDEELRDSLLTGTNAGFTSQQTRGAMGDILSAGGSTKTARESATLSNRLQRNFDLTNASSAMGRISSLTSSSGNTDASITRVLAEAMSLGLDNSEFAEEQRRFVDISTQVISRSGAVDGNQMDVSAGFSKFVSGPEMYKIEGAKSAYDLSQSISGEAGGARGAIKAAALMRDPNLSKLNRDQRSSLLQMSEEQINAGGIDIEGMALSAGFENVDDFKKSVKNMQSQSMSTRADIDKQAEILKTSKKGSKEYKIAASKYISGMGYDTGVGNLSAAGKEAFIEGNVFGNKDALKIAENEMKVNAKAEGKTGRTGDDYVAGQAAGDAAYIQTMSMFSKEIDKANTDVSKFSGQIAQTVEILRTLNSDDSAGLAKFSKILGDLYGKISSTPQGKELVQEKGSSPDGK